MTSRRLSQIAKLLAWILSLKTASSCGASSRLTTVAPSSTALRLASATSSYRRLSRMPRRRRARGLDGSDSLRYLHDRQRAFLRGRFAGCGLGRPLDHRQPVHGDGGEERLSILALHAVGRTPGFVVEARHLPPYMADAGRQRVYVAHVLPPDAGAHRRRLVERMMLQVFRAAPRREISAVLYPGPIVNQEQAALGRELAEV